MFYNLFYGPQSNNIGLIAEKYYELFPEELHRASGRMLKMLGSGTLRERNLVVLESFAADLDLTEYEVNLANDLTIAYFQSFLQEAATVGLKAKDLDAQVNRFLEGAFFVLRGKSDR
jgi:hypothetical protein